ncbi:MAG: AbrB/MazE/SpoVT family DNA-binding domain-containing protein [Bifidobacteriaceae bacterium]|jgi:AbrB family looped-hinge helix DNA binding protein|nr:AbrB/MazE/SpoVT family DNA-binding domain-containing protein [Bifidobacteriaceae bacterium]
MPTATVTVKGQITIPAEVRRKLRIHTGTQIDFVEDSSGGFLIRPRRVDLMDLSGSAATGVRATLQEIEDGIGRGAAEAAGLAR